MGAHIDISEYKTLDPPRRTLMGPGPSDVHPRVLRALATPTIGHMDPCFLEYMDEIRELLQSLYKTQNEVTFAVSGTGSAGMEACLVNVLEAGDRVVVAQNGVFGKRMADIVERLNCELIIVEAPFGEAVQPDMVRRAIGGKKTKLVSVVHAETSTGVCNPLSEIAEVAHEVDALVLADCVTSLGGQAVEIDEWGIDLAYSGTQKCLSCPPGLAPVTFSPRAVSALQNRVDKPQSWYFDLSMLLNYWGGERVYHHTAPINMLYALREALIVLMEEGLDNVFYRHQINHDALVSGLEAMGLEMLVAPEFRLAQLNTVIIPQGADDIDVRSALLDEFNIEIGGGLGELKNRVWRVGLMGHASRKENVMSFLAALETVLNQQGVRINRGEALDAAQSVYHAFQA